MTAFRSAEFASARTRALRVSAHCRWRYDDGRRPSREGSGI